MKATEDIKREAVAVTHERLRGERDALRKELVFLGVPSRTLGRKIDKLLKRAEKGGRIDPNYVRKLEDDLNKVRRKKLELGLKIMHNTMRDHDIADEERRNERKRTMEKTGAKRRGALHG